MKKYVIKTGGILILIFLSVLCALYFRVREMNTTRILLVNNSSIPVDVKKLSASGQHVWSGTIQAYKRKKFQRHISGIIKDGGAVTYSISDRTKIYKGLTGYAAESYQANTVIVYDTDNNVYVYHLDDWKRYCTGLSPESPYGKKVCRCAGWKNTDWHYIQEDG